MKTVLIAEKPSVAMDISRALPDSFTRREGYLEGETLIITWAVGHLLELAMPQDYNLALKRWRLEVLPYFPQVFKLKARGSTGKQLKVIEALIKREDVDRLINACDAGREGELIFRYILQYLSCFKPHRRLWLSETTPAAIRTAFANLRTGEEMENLARAAVARSQADWIVGINATRAYSVLNQDKMTVGRVQTPTLALIVKREREIENFVPTQYWEIEADFETESGTYQGKWFQDQKDRFYQREEAEAILAKLIPGSPAVVTSLEQKETRELPPQLFNLNDLQKEANKRFGFTAEQTLGLAQKLYEAHLLTYPRTDSRHLTRSLAETLPTRLKALQGTELTEVINSISTQTISDKRYVDDKKVTDHTAIIITDSKPFLEKMAEAERKIYLLVARRLVGIYLPFARFLQTTVVTLTGEETFVTKGKMVLALGWKVLYEEEKGDSQDKTLPRLTPNQEVGLKEVGMLDKKTQSPKRYTEADLLSAMENAGRQVEDQELREAMKGKGLGTPATRAGIIEKLIATGYITRQKKALVPTEKGKYLIECVNPQLKDPEFTGEWEKRLLDIEQGQYQDQAFMKEIKEFAWQIIDELKAEKRTRRASFTNDLGLCPVCGHPIIEGKKGYGCSAWKTGCKFVIWKEVAGKKVTEAQVKKLLKSGRTNLIKGFKSKSGRTFDACLKISNAQVVFEFPEG